MKTLSLISSAVLALGMTACAESTGSSSEYGQISGRGVVDDVTDGYKDDTAKPPDDTAKPPDDVPAPPGECCPKTIGFWKNHPDAWPVDFIDIGGVVYSVGDAIANILDGANAKDATWMLAAQLVAAKLNVVAGDCNGAVATDIADADAFLVANPLFSDPQGELREEALHLKDHLDEFNNSNHCEDEEKDGENDEDGDKDEDGEKDKDEETDSGDKD